MILSLYMKKIIISALGFLMVSNIISAQTSSDAFLFANRQLSGTARYNALSGAFGALGGDLTAVSENPAASAVFTNSFGSVTLGIRNSEYDNNYFGTTTETDESEVGFDQVGAVLILKSDNSHSSINKIALAFNYNKTADFDSEFTIIGSSNNTIGDFFVGQANGISSGNLSVFENESLAGAYISIGNIYGTVGQQAFLGFQSGLIDPVADGEDVSDFVSVANGNNVNQDIRVRSSGSAGKLSFNLGVAYNSGLHLGGNLNLHTLNRRKETDFFERNTVADINYIVEEVNTGAGFSADFGLIYKVKDNLRLGLVYQTPTFFGIDRTVDQFIVVDFIETEDEVAFSQLVDPQVEFEQDLYSLQTPGKFAASAAYIFGNKGLLSFEYSTQDFSNTKYGSSFSGASEINDIIEDTYKRVHSYKIGAEIRNNNWSFRGGLNGSSTPFEDSNLDGDSSGFSLGTGYDWGKWKFDLAYNHSELSSTENTFENRAFTNAANIEESRDVITATLGVNF